MQEALTLPIRALISTLVACGVFASAAASAGTTDADRGVPHYDHIIVIVEENKTYARVLERGYAPHISNLAKHYGIATQMYAETHPSEPNYVAMLGGDTFGIHDDDAWYCKPQQVDRFCRGSEAPGYVAHLIDAPNLAAQLQAKNLIWRAYTESIPEPGSLAIISPETDAAPAALYAAKHTGFTNFASVHRDGNLANELVGFDAWHSDVATGHLPAFAFVIPNQCDEMHGVMSIKSPPGCGKNDGELIARGDAQVGALVQEIQASTAWTARGVRTAIVITWDEDDNDDRAPTDPQGCCVIDAHNPGGGHIPTIVITNHGPIGVTDTTPYDHYSLLRTIEDALGLDGHVGHAGDAAVVPMARLFGPLR